MPRCVKSARDVSVQALNPMCKSETFEKLQRAIDRRRFGRLARLAVSGDEVVGLQRAVAPEQKFQNAATGLGQSLLGAGAAVIGHGDRLPERATLQSGVSAVLMLTIRSVHIFR